MSADFLLLITAIRFQLFLISASINLLLSATLMLKMYAFFPGIFLLYLLIFYFKILESSPLLVYNQFIYHTLTVIGSFNHMIVRDLQMFEGEPFSINYWQWILVQFLPSVSLVTLHIIRLKIEQKIFQQRHLDCAYAICFQRKTFLHRLFYSPCNFAGQLNVFSFS